MTDHEQKAREIALARKAYGIPDGAETTPMCYRLADEIRAYGDQRAAEEREACAREIEGLRKANSARPDYNLFCGDCGRAHFLDTSLPSDVWNQIANPEDVLCTVCIDKRLADCGLEAEAEFYYAGTALVSRLYEPSEIGADNDAAILAYGDAKAKEEREAVAAMVDDFSWVLPMFDSQDLNEVTDDVACAVQEQIAAAIRNRD